MPIARPRKHPTRNARQAAYQSRKDAKVAEFKRSAEMMRAAVQTAAARGLIPLLSVDDGSAEAALVELLKRVEVGGNATASG